MSIQIIEAKRSDLETQAVRFIETGVRDVLKRKENAVLGISGGRSVQGVLKLLQQSRIPWNTVHIFWVDERFVSPKDDESNYKNAKEGFLDVLTEKRKLSEKNIHPFIYNSLAADGGVRAYTELFLRYGNSFDIVLLGVGEDGHVASLFPNHASVSDDSEYFITVENSPKPPPKRMSASGKLLGRSERGIFLFFGKEKKSAFDRFRDENVPIEKCPSKIAKHVKETLVLADVV
ncbi:MAG: 6-phosphogluconolactonase [Candidatus Ryanbacteria bacterium RIFCSPHIGHO2_02_FULL_45_43]|uniref:6-phosphogluconolactonase n=1 Tax=Candidatus Ryanbacteria bacterium RIFCSPHIGHO2_01_45_13 TaxID=1802112 RepID=A0A1G2FUS7_9BACT|nr:MAG: 6-phosphogluconolactonase [Candidatus Ryanbacteria bacterium RIFCSPHIGHO2_01_45_13]OGZ41501.1 MAG: 6-phosphogluconolactonase [Candidatus Ryanbacteria bacterium RIFCSPHIGHO2_01_FULL_44_130]OGZ47968.1 MAG: 6-phosphogluconolactonase [Candidatus Ryanbacteria bacterium RIFCSPHIGHO2_02_FULL_45_43]OGZ50104.1 MAG: 6-phosphogluconolactonase [Candidatus Ryanbacteria bacterium RIFCSPHIGHO2_12_FULL_44_20]OGZ51106.1 MAG: 6-phosphogluconolactonase [Candidatus Ryanbacteria bacterium RIFCSPLOWO2_01_FUL